MKDVASSTTVDSYNATVATLKSSSFWKGELEQWFDRIWLKFSKVRVVITRYFICLFFKSGSRPIFTTSTINIYTCISNLKTYNMNQEYNILRSI